MFYVPIPFCFCVAENISCHTVYSATHRRRSGWNSGGRMASPEGGVWEGCPLSSQVLWRSVVSSPSGIRGGERILAYFEGHRTLLFVPICWCFEQSGAWNFKTWQNLRGTTCISVSTPNSWGTCPSPSPVIYIRPCTLLLPFSWIYPHLTTRKTTLMIHLVMAWLRSTKSINVGPG